MGRTAGNTGPSAWQAFDGQGRALDLGVGKQLRELGAEVTNASRQSRSHRFCDYSSPKNLSQNSLLPPGEKVRMRGIVSVTLTLPSSPWMGEEGKVSVLR